MMTWLVRIAVLIVALASAAVLAIAVWPAAQDRIVSAAAERALSDHKDALMADDALRLVVCGSSSPIPSRQRAQSCTAIIAGGKIFIVDAGPGSWRSFAAMRLPGQAIAGVLLTHFHSDHFGDLGEFRLNSWVAGRSAPLPVYGPTGVADVVNGVNLAFAQDDAYRRAHHGALLAANGAALEARDFGLADLATRSAHVAEAIVYDKDGLRVTAFQVIHEPVFPAVGYRFDYRGRSIVISGDTIAAPGLAAHAKGADVLVAEAQSAPLRKLIGAAAARAGETRVAQIFHDIETYHMTPEDVLRLANTADVRFVLLSHLSPPPDNFISRRVFTRGLDRIRPRATWAIAEDGAVISLPIGADLIERTNPR